jgi:hypothetical protein
MRIPTSIVTVAFLAYLPWLSAAAAATPSNTPLESADKAKYDVAVAAARGAHVDNNLLRATRAAVDKLKTQRDDLVREIEELSNRPVPNPRKAAGIRAQIEKKKDALAKLDKSRDEAEARVKHLESLERLGQNFRIIQTRLEYKQDATAASEMRKSFTELRNTKCDEASYAGMNSGVKERIHRVKDTSSNGASLQKEKSGPSEEGGTVRRKEENRNVHQESDEAVTKLRAKNPGYRDFIEFVGTAGARMAG